MGGYYTPPPQNPTWRHPFAHTFQSVYCDSWGRIQVHQSYVSLTNFFNHQVMFLRSGSALAAFISRAVNKMHSES